MSKILFAFTTILTFLTMSSKAVPMSLGQAHLRSWNPDQNLETRALATYYNPSDPIQNHGYVNIGSCGNYIDDNSMIVAVSFSHGKPCGSCVSIRANGKCINARVEDSCYGCNANHIDLTPALFSQFAPLSAGQLNVDWDFSCSCGNSSPSHHETPSTQSVHNNDIGYCTASNDFSQCTSGCCHEGICAESHVCFGHE